jgi:hypothetical protein
MVARHSRHIGHKAAQTIYYAIGEHAARIGLPITHLVTINFSLTGIQPDRAVEAFQIIRRSRFNKWATRPRKGAGAAFTPTYVYWFENVRDNVAIDGPDETQNVHVHWLVHLPAERSHDFKGRLWGWVDELAGSISAGNAIDIKPAYNPKGLRPYALKGAAPATAKHFGATPIDQGLIVGRRAGTSANLGPKARIALDKQLRIRRRAA